MSSNTKIREEASSLKRAAFIVGSILIFLVIVFFLWRWLFDTGGIYDFRKDELRAWLYEEEPILTDLEELPGYYEEFCLRVETTFNDKVLRKGPEFKFGFMLPNGEMGVEARYHLECTYFGPPTRIQTRRILAIELPAQKGAGGFYQVRGKQIYSSDFRQILKNIQSNGDPSSIIERIRSGFIDQGSRHPDIWKFQE